MSGWVQQRECANCAFAGPETEFMAAGQSEDGSMVLMHRDGATDAMVYICCGCAAGLGALSHEMMRAAVWRLLLRDVGAVLDEAEALWGDLDSPVPYALTEKAAV